jgi:soluble lytic murein transglycosylase-like protein
MACLLLGSTPTSSPAALPIPMGTPDGTAAGVLSPVFTPEVQAWSNWIAVWAFEAGVDPNLAATVMQIESCGDPQARSSAGAAGLFQVMPFHFGFDENPFDPATNARRGLAYLRRALDASAGDPRLALAGYNGGISVIGRPESAWAAETQRYARWGGGIYAEAVSGAGESARLQEWLEAGGASLCRRSHQRLGLP